MAWLREMARRLCDGASPDGGAGEAPGGRAKLHGERPARVHGGFRCAGAVAHSAAGPARLVRATSELPSPAFVPEPWLRPPEAGGVRPRVLRSGPAVPLHGE